MTKYFFLHIPKTAGSALTALLEVTPKGDACVQCHRAVRSLIASVDRRDPSEAEPVGLADSQAATNLPGFGLSPRLRDRGSARNARPTCGA